jgi:signal transduction protein with GAF and PtsI domain
MRRERVDYDHIHWKCTCGYKSKTQHTTPTKRVNPYESISPYRLDLDDEGRITLLSKEERRVDLLSIEEISRLTSSSEKLDDILHDIVETIAVRLGVDVCSIYLLKEDSLVLMATHGLSQNAVGKVMMKVGEGITGNAAAGNEPITVIDAAADSRYKHFEDTEEDRYRGMVSCPIKEGDRLLGVLNVQTEKLKAFNIFEDKYIRIVSNLIKNCLLIREKQ